MTFRLPKYDDQNGVFGWHDDLEDLIEALWSKTRGDTVLKPFVDFLRATALDTNLDKANRLIFHVWYAEYKATDQLMHGLDFSIDHPDLTCEHFFQYVDDAIVACYAINVWVRDKEKP